VIDRPVDVVGDDPSGVGHAGFDHGPWPWRITGAGGGTHGPRPGEEWYRCRVVWRPMHSHSVGGGGCSRRWPGKRRQTMPSAGALAALCD
jgi:hypothetical protein